MDTDVLVVGAGPTGLMLANQLARHGVRPIIIDRHAGPARETRALGVQARTLEIYAHLGIVERAFDLGRRATGATLWAEGKRTARVPLGDIGQGLSPYPFLLILGQDDNEKLLGEALARHGLAVQWNTELVALSEQPAHVVATVLQAGGTERTLSAGWIAGCDGAHSTVRRLNGIPFEGAPYEHVFFVADTMVTGPMIRGEINVSLWRSGFHLFFPMRGSDHWRVVGIVPSGLRDKESLTFDDVIPSIQSEAGPALSFQACSWFSTYRIHHRRAQRFASGRSFLLGDAAHIHSPVGAQGMNTGLQDAYNLAWKLALVVSGRARDGLLDSYAAERIPVARRLLETTDRAFSLAVSDRKLAGFFRTRVLARMLAGAMRMERIRRLAFNTISQIGIRYRDSPLSQNLASLAPGAPHAGDRFPWLRVKRDATGPAENLFALLDDTRWKLLVIGQPVVDMGVPESVLQVLHIDGAPDNGHELARAKIPRPSFYLLRPDGHIGLTGMALTADAVRRYLSVRVGLTL
jgi:2-polyprenyl-6-methoxyphenol hydroxylase-like FAD-dependent oxidoreductase